MQIVNYYDVFISFKDSDEEGNDTKDKAIAHELYLSLNKKGFKVFFSPETFADYGVDKWSVELEDALNISKVFITVGVTKEYMISKHLIWERTFFSALRSKDNSRAIYSYIAPPMTLNDLPSDMSDFSAFTPKNIEKLYIYISNHIEKRKKKTLYKVFASFLSVALLVGYMSNQSVTIDRLEEELLKYKDNPKVLNQANTIKNTLGDEETLKYLKSTNKDLYYANLKQKIWLQQNINKVAFLFDTNETEDRTRIALAVTRKGGEFEKATGSISLKSSDEYLLIKNSTWSPNPMGLKVLDGEGNIVYEDIHEEGDVVVFIVPREVLRDGYRVLVLDGFGDLVVDVEVKL